MNLIDESFEPKQTNNSKKMTKIVLIMIIVSIIAIVAIFIAIIYMKKTTLTLYIDGKSNENVKQMMVEEDDGTIYFPIKDIATYLGYQSFNGEYANKSEDASKCYIQNENEIANFSLNSNKVYTLTTSNTESNYSYFYADKPIKAMNGKLYATIDTIQKAFNISFSYVVKDQNIYMYTMPYLIQSYSTGILNLGYESISPKFVNQKAILNNMIIVTKAENSIYAVIDTSGNTIIEPKYDYIEYLPNSGDFLVQSNGKVGIISAQRETKVQILYDSLELVDRDAALYIAERDNKYGVIDSKGNIKIYIEYDEIGIDISKFEKNNIKNKYLLDNGMIPARKDKLWGAFDKNGNQVLDFAYDKLGYIASANKDAINLLLIPDYNVLVAHKYDSKYLLIDSDGKELCFPVLDDVYMTISGGKEYYYMNYYGNEGVNVEDFFDTISFKPSSSSKNNTKVNESVTNEFIDVDDEN